MLEASSLRAGYGALEVLHGIDFDVEAGGITVILGPNGAGKTTVMKAISGLVPANGELDFDGHAMAGIRPEKRVRNGMSLVPQGRGTLNDLTVEENLLVGAYTYAGDVNAAVERWCEVFAVLGHRRSQLAGTLSGGEQQMLAVARALISEPKLLLLDEPSLGLAPLVVRSMYDQIQEISDTTGTTMLIVEQNAKVALAVASRAFVLEAGHIVAGGSASEINENDALRRAYLGF